MMGAYIDVVCSTAKEACREIQELDTGTKNSVIKATADLIHKYEPVILKANEADMKADFSSGMDAVSRDRLYLTRERIEEIEQCLQEVLTIPDPVGEVLDEWLRPSGIYIQKVRVPLGTVGIVSESQPDITVKAFSLALKAGNTVVIKTSRAAYHTNLEIVKLIKDALIACQVTEHAIEVIQSDQWEDTVQFIRERSYLNLLIPCCSMELTNEIISNSSIPVIATANGKCHIYVDKDADFSKATSIILDTLAPEANFQKNTEFLIIHKSIAGAFLPLLITTFQDRDFHIYTDEPSISYMRGVKTVSTEKFLTGIPQGIMVKTVNTVNDAISYVNRSHSDSDDCIITENIAIADQFMKLIDSACVYVNASPSFTDGFEFGFGADIGTIVQKLQARGPIGMKELTSYKYLIEGHGTIRNREQDIKR